MCFERSGPLRLPLQSRTTPGQELALASMALDDLGQ
jgi:hypothetical protein